ncbi:MAG: trehalose-phosphatase [Chloroflexota bacterium]
MQGLLHGPESIRLRLSQAKRLSLFLDYDGTLADFAATPDEICPNPALIELLSRLVQQPNLRLALVSGRRLDQVRQLLPIPGMLLAGTYGVEILTGTGEHINRLDFDQVRPVLEAIKPAWQALLVNRQGFFLEDKGWSLALHARFAENGEAEQVLSTARQEVSNLATNPDFRLLGGHKFLEFSPILADKGQTVRYLLESYPYQGALPVCLGDDDKDERAFEVVQNSGGIAILVSSSPRTTLANLRLESTRAARGWLAGLLDEST